jgi:hypothetical protein
VLQVDDRDQIRVLQSGRHASLVQEQASVVRIRVVGRQNEFQRHGLHESLRPLGSPRPDLSHATGADPVLQNIFSDAVSRAHG